MSRAVYLSWSWPASLVHRDVSWISSVWREEHCPYHHDMCALVVYRIKYYSNGWMPYPDFQRLQSSAENGGPIPSDFSEMIEKWKWVTWNLKFVTISPHKGWFQSGRQTSDTRNKKSEKKKKHSGVHHYFWRLAQVGFTHVGDTILNANYDNDYTFEYSGEWIRGTSQWSRQDLSGIFLFFFCIISSSYFPLSCSASRLVRAWSASWNLP